MDAPIAVAHPRLADFPDPQIKAGLTGASGPVMVGRGIERQDLAGPSDRYAPVHQHSVDQLELPGRPQSFRRMTCLTASRDPASDPPRSSREDCSRL